MSKPVLWSGMLLRDYLKTDFGIDFSAKNRNSLHEFLGFEIVTKPNESLEVWVAKRWAWMNTEVIPTTVNGLPVLSSSLIADDLPVFQQFLWIESDDRYYVAQAYSLTDDEIKIGRLQNIIVSLTFK